MDVGHYASLIRFNLTRSKSATNVMNSLMTDLAVYEEIFFFF